MRHDEVIGTETQTETEAETYPPTYSSSWPLILLRAISAMLLLRSSSSPAAN